MTLVVSHDGIYPEVAKVIDSIDFCRVKEIIFPWNRQWLDDLAERHHTSWKKSIARSIGLPRFHGGGMLKHTLWCKHVHLSTLNGTNV